MTPSWEDRKLRSGRLKQWNFLTEYSRGGHSAEKELKTSSKGLPWIYCWKPNFAYFGEASRSLAKEQPENWKVHHSQSWQDLERFEFCSAKLETLLIAREWDPQNKHPFAIGFNKSLKKVYPCLIWPRF